MTDRISVAQWRLEEKPRRKPYADHEHQEQVALFNWLATQSRIHPELELVFAIPNGGKRSRGVAGKLKAEGVKPGVPDICCPFARGPYHALFIEMKSLTGATTREQKIWIERLNAQGYLAVVRKGWVAAKNEIENYLAMEK